MKPSLAGPPRGRASHLVSCISLGLHGKQRESLLTAVSGELLREEPARGLRVPFWTGADLKYLAERLWGPMKLAGWRRSLNQGCFSLLQPRYGLSPACTIAFSAQQEWEGQHGTGPRDGWRSRSTLPEWRFYPYSVFLPPFLHSSLSVLPYLTAERLWYMVLWSDT